MAEELLHRSDRAVTDLRRLATPLNDAGYPGDAICIQDFAGMLREHEYKLAEAQAKIESELLGATLAERFELEQPADRKSTKRQRNLPISGSQRAIVAP